MTIPTEMLSTTVLDGEKLASYRPMQEDTVPSQRLAAFAAAIGETQPARLAGEVAPPTFAFVPFTDLLVESFDDMLEGKDNNRLVHTHQRFTLHRPVRAGDKLRVDGRVVRLSEGPFGAVLDVAGTLTELDGTPVVEQLATLLVPGARVVNPLGEAPPPASPAAARSARGGSVDVDVAADLTVRYADASGDQNPIHLDPAAARSVGFPGVLVHGMATLALAVHAIETALPGRGDVTGLAIEWTRPVFPGDRLSVRYADRTDDPEVGGVTFEVANRKRRTVMRGGLLTFSGTA